MMVAGFEFTQHHLVALLAQGLARLRARVVELARLADDDGAGAYDQNFRNVRSFRHVSGHSLYKGKYMRSFKFPLIQFLIVLT